MGISLSKIIGKENRWILRGLLLNLLDAIKGKQQDYTQVSIKRAIFFLSVPMVLEMLMESIFAVVDIYFVSKISAEAVATVGLTESVIVLVYAIGIGLGIGTSAIVSRRVGEKNTKDASKYAAQGIFITIITSVLISLVGIFYASDILRLMGAEQSIIDNYSTYATIMITTNATILLLFVINGIFRSAGKPAISMQVLIIANTLNIILDPVLIFGFGPIPALGITGAAVATSIGRGIAVIIQFIILFRSKENINMILNYFIPVWKKIRELLDIAISGIGQILIITISWMVLTRIVAIFGSEAIAAYTIAIRVFLFFILPVDGITNAVATLVGQNLGAKNPERAEKAISLAVKITVSLLTILGVIMYFGAEYFIHFFNNDKEVLEMGVVCLQIFSFGMPIFGFGMVYNRSLNGAGDTINPTKINLLAFIIVEIPLAYILSVVLNIGIGGVLYAVLIADSLMSCLAFLVVRKGKWKLKEI
jgi:putative MATE family efflux protein